MLKLCTELPDAEHVHRDVEGKHGRREMIPTATKSDYSQGT